jgi:hypothetical protein
MNCFTSHEIFLLSFKQVQSSCIKSIVSKAQVVQFRCATNKGDFEVAVKEAD